MLLAALLNNMWGATLCLLWISTCLFLENMYLNILYSQDQRVEIQNLISQVGNGYEMNKIWCKFAFVMAFRNIIDVNDN